MADGEVLVLCQEMTISREEFMRILPAAVNQFDLCVDGDVIRPIDAGPCWRIVLSALDDLRLGAIRLPRQRVEIYLANGDEAARARFVSRFEQHFRRGGG